MLIFSEVEEWEDDAGVHQILVFPNEEVKTAFEAAYKHRQEHGPKTIGGYADQNGIGAIYKIRAIRHHDGTWASVIRCGFNGRLIDERTTRKLTPHEALSSGIDLLAALFSVDCNVKSRDLRGLPSDSVSAHA